MHTSKLVQLWTCQSSTHRQCVMETTTMNSIEKGILVYLLNILTVVDPARKRSKLAEEYLESTAKSRLNQTNFVEIKTCANELLRSRPC